MKASGLFLTAMGFAALAACTHVERSGHEAGHRPQPRDLPVEVAVTSVVLDGDCPAREAQKSGAAEPLVADRFRAEQAESACRQSRVSLQLVAGKGDTAARIEVVSVRLHDESGKHLQDLPARTPRVWSAATSMFEPWNQTISPGQELDVGYDLGAPDWARIGGGDAWATAGMGFHVTVVVRVGGKEHTLDREVESPFFTREPMIET